MGDSDLVVVADQSPSSCFLIVLLAALSGRLSPGPNNGSPLANAWTTHRILSTKAK